MRTRRLPFRFLTNEGLAVSCPFEALKIHLDCKIFARGHHNALYLRGPYIWYIYLGSVTFLRLYPTHNTVVNTRKTLP